MADETKRPPGEPFFDTDRAWERFERMAADKPVPAFWRQAEADDELHAQGTAIEARQNNEQANDKKDGVNQMGNIENVQGTSHRAKNTNGNSAWRTERPARRLARRLTAGAAAAVILAGLFTTPLGDRALAAMQQTFRIQHMVGVGLTADDLTGISKLLENGSPEGDRSFNLAQYGSLTQSGGGKNQTLSWDEADKQMGGSLIHLLDATDPSYQPATTLTFNLNVKAVNRLLTRLGSTTTLPDDADGKSIKLHVPASITTEGTLTGKPVRLLQSGKPELTVDGDIDTAAIREAVLSLPVLPDSLRSKLAAIGDWQRTLPVPAKDGVTTSLQLGGHDAVMTVNGSNRYLLWLDGDRMGLLSGSTNDFEAESDFQQAAEALILP